MQRYPTFLVALFWLGFVFVGCASPPSEPQAPVAAPTTATGANTTPQATAAAAPLTPPSPALIYARSDQSLWRLSDSLTPQQLAPANGQQTLLRWAVSPNGQSIAFLSGSGILGKPEPGVTPELSLWLVNSDGSNLRKIQSLLPRQPLDRNQGDLELTVLPALTGLQELAWSPDGWRLAFVSAHEGQVDLYVYSATEPGELQRLTDTPALEQGPQWAPGGRALAYRTATSFGTGAGWSDAGISLSVLDPGAPAPPVDKLGLGAGNTQFTPSLIWVGPDALAAVLLNFGGGQSEVRIVQASSAEPTTIFTGEVTAVVWSQQVGTLALSAGSFSGQGSDPKGVFLWHPGDPSTTQLVDEAEITGLVWRPQGDTLAYTVEGRSNPQSQGVWLVSPGGEPRKLSPRPTWELLWAADGQGLATHEGVYTLDGTTLLSYADTRTAPVAWGPQGLFLVEPDASGADQLLLWDGRDTRRIDGPISRLGIQLTP